MIMKNLFSSLVALAVLGSGCSETSTFKGQPQMGTAAKKAADAKPAPAVPAPVTLQLLLPSSEIRSGSKTLQASVNITGSTESKVAWSVEGPAGVDVGSIDSNGLYTSPATLAAEAEIKIAASLIDEPSIQDSDRVKVIPAEQIFVGCSMGSSIFPIVAEVYKLPVNTQELPDFSMIQGDKSTTVCMDQYNVPVRNFNEGFPGVPDLLEWFALHTTAKITVPTAGYYNFRLNSDDGAILYIDGKVVLNNDGQHSPWSIEGGVDLTAGSHDLVLDYFQGPADQIALELFWQVPDSPDFTVVPASAFQN